MVNCSIMKLMCRKPLGILPASQKVERKAFVFTVRTEVRLGGL